MGSRVQNQTSEAEIDRTPGIQSLQKWLEGPRNGWEVTTTLTNLPTRETSIPAFLVNVGTWKLPVNWVQRQCDAVNTQNKDNYHCPWKPRKLVSSTFFRTLAAREPGNHSFCLSHSVTIEKKKKENVCWVTTGHKGYPKSLCQRSMTLPCQIWFPLEVTSKWGNGIPSSTF